MSPEPEPYQDDEDEEYAPQSIFAAGWFRAVLVLTVLAIVVVVSLPYLLNWFEPTPTIPTSAPRASLTPPAPAPAPATPSASPVVENKAAAPQAAAPKLVEPRAREGKPAEARPAPKAVAERPGAEKPAAPAKGAADKPVQTAAARAPERAAKPEPRVAASLPKAAESSPPAAAGARPARAESGGSYWLQLGLFKDQANAESLARSVREQGFAVEIRQIAKSDGGVAPGTYHLVRAGGFPDRASAGKAREALGAKGHQGFVTKSATP